MTEEFIRIHKPAVFRQQQVEPITPKRSKSKSRKSVGAKREKIEQGPKCDALENMFNLFEDRISETKKAIHKDLFESIYENTLQYFSFYESKRELFASSSLGLNPICNVIPTVALYTGINVQDYSYLCDKLSGSLRDNFTEYLFFVNEKNANNIKTLVNSIYMQWENLTDEEEKSKLPKKNMFSFRVFFDSIKAENKKPVIFFFKQFELIPKETIENFVSLISCYVENVSIYFILELASQSNIINQQLSSGVISKLCIKKLYLMSPSQYMDRFITQLFIEGNLLFKVSGDILKYLVDIYNDYNFSISGLTHALKYCYYDHLHANSLNAYMLSDELESFETHEMVLKQVMGNENRANQELFNKLTEPLFGTHPISINLRKVQNQVKQYSSEFLLVSMLLFEIVKQFPASAAGGENDQESVVFSSSSAHTFSDFFVRIWCFSSSSATSNKPFCELDEFGNLKRLLHLTSSNTLVGMIDAMMSLIQKKAMENEASYDVEFLNEVFTFHNDVLEVMKTKLAALGNSNLNKSFNEEEDEDISELRSLSKGTESLEAAAASAAKVRRTKSLVTRRPSLRSTAAPSTLKPISENYSPTKKLKASTTNTKQQREDKQKLSKEIDSLKSSMISWLSEKFSHYFNFATYKAQPFMSHYCYSNLERLKTALFDVPRLNIHACLLNSFAYLKSNESSSSSYSCSPNKKPKLTLLNREPDTLGMLPINVVYRVYLECGHMINLFDWLQAFVDKMENVGIDELDAAKKKTLIALFFRSITELQFMGFIKPTSRKVDHVVKLTNGSSLLALE